MFAAALAHELADRVPGLTFDPSAAGANVFLEHMPPAPDTDVTIGVFTAPAGAELSRQPDGLPAVQVRVRCNREDPRPAHAMAARIRAEFDCLGYVTFAAGTDDETYVVGMTATTTDPVALGRDDNERPEFTVTFTARTHAPTALRPA